MKITPICTVAILTLLNSRAVAQNELKREPAQKPKATSVQTEPAQPKPTAEELEAKFKATLTKAKMSGRWCAIEKGALGPENEDQYSILGVTRLGGDAWLINARVQYNRKDFVAPVPVLVKWAGDTPVLIVDKIPMPGGGVFSARVLIYEHTYAGTWSGGGHGGLLKGIITTEPAGKPAAK